MCVLVCGVFARERAIDRANVCACLSVLAGVYVGAHARVRACVLWQMGGVLMFATAAAIPPLRWLLFRVGALPKPGEAGSAHPRPNPPANPPAHHCQRRQSNHYITYTTLYIYIYVIIAIRNNRARKINPRRASAFVGTTGSVQRTDPVGSV